MSHQGFRISNDVIRSTYRHILNKRGGNPFKCFNQVSLYSLAFTSCQELSWEIPAVLK